MGKTMGKPHGKTNGEYHWKKMGKTNLICISKHDNVLTNSGWMPYALYSIFLLLFMPDSIAPRTGMVALVGLGQNAVFPSR